MTETIHPAAARGYAETADLYERARPGYPDDALAAIVEGLGLRAGRTMLELGAGTGKLTRRLAPAGGRIVALEPVAGMRAKLAAVVADATGHDGDAEVDIIDGTAEAIPLPNASVDGVVAAQAFHWFDAIRALSEVHRVLRPGGRFVLAWNRRDESVPWVKAIGDRIRTLAGDEPQVWDDRWPAALRRCALFEPWQQADFRQSHRLTRAGVLERVASVSFVAAAEPSAQAEVLADVEALLRDDPATAGREVIDLPYDTQVMWATRRSIDPGLEGVVASVNLNRGGVPKPPVDGTWIRTLGLDGDGHHNPDVHGGPTAAVCLYPQEAIERVRADGHQAFPGSYGENLTLLGIDWSRLRDADRLELGDPGGSEADGSLGPLLELTQYATPCATQAPWFVEGRIARISHRVRPEDARWYARVLREGPVRPGMAVRVVREG
jgi:MOSC domain-containing protein YiiM/SAM-dependent methyltransferase